MEAIASVREPLAGHAALRKRAPALRLGCAVRPRQAREPVCARHAIDKRRTRLSICAECGYSAGVFRGLLAGAATLATVVLVTAVGVGDVGAQTFSGYRHVCRSGYCVDLPAGWRFRDNSFPSDHLTHFYWNPANALEQMTVIVSGCVGCVSRNLDP